MALSFSTDTETQTNTAFFGDPLVEYTTEVITLEIQNISVSGDPVWIKESAISRWVWGNEEPFPNIIGQTATSIFSGNYTPDSRWMWYAPDLGRDLMTPPDWPGSRITNIIPYVVNGECAKSIFFREDSSQLRFRDVNNLAIHGNDPFVFPLSAPGGLASAVGNTVLNDWYYPDVTHLFITPDSTTGGSPPIAGHFRPMTDQPPTSPLAVIQPYIDVISRDRGPQSAELSAIGSYDLSGAEGRAQSNGTSINGGGSFWYPPARPLILTLSWEFAVAISSLQCSAIYGLPPVEISYAASYTYTDVPSGSNVSSIELKLRLRQFKSDDTFLDSVIATVNVPLVQTETFTCEDPGPGPDIHGTVKAFVLQPQDSGHSATLDDDTVAWIVFGTAATTSDNLSLDAETSNETYPGTLPTRFMWHKFPCYVRSYGLSCNAGEESTYLPGWLCNKFG